MTASHITRRTRLLAITGAIAGVVCLSMATAGSAQAVSVLDGPIDLGTAATYGALAASGLTNTGPTTVDGDIGVAPQTSITGFTGAPNGSFTGAENDDNAAALQAQSDLTTAHNNAAGLTPTTSGLTELTGLSLTPGVYSGGALSLANNNTLTLAGTSANSIWVFQAASSLTIGSGTHITITGGATACNVFWEVGSSASIGTNAQFQGTILAADSITAATGATVAGRLLASTAAVTLQSNAITVPTGCAAGNPPTTSPAITTTSLAAATQGTPYSFGITATGTPSPTFAVSAGTLPAGLTLDETTGVISGTSTSPGSSTFTVTASNGFAPDASATFTLVTRVPVAAGSGAPLPGTGVGTGLATAAGAPVLGETGVDPTPALTLAAGLLAAGAMLLVGRRRRTKTNSAS